MPAERVVILGGGLGALSTAFELSDPRHQGRYDVTVYQLGWRLGGKGASGRTRPIAGSEPADDHCEIIEHGIHVFMGFYEDSFSVMRQCYAELDRPPGSPCRTWKDAFKPHASLTLMEHIEDQWLPWEFSFPKMPGEPGLSPRRTDFWTISKDWLLHTIEHQSAELFEHLGDLEDGLDPAKLQAAEPSKPHWWDRLLHLHGTSTPSSHFGAIGTHLLRELVTSLGDDPATHSTEKLSWIGWLLDELRKWLLHVVDHLLAKHSFIRRAFILIDYAATHLRGILADGLLLPGGFESINHLDWKQWLTLHHGSPWMLESPMVLCFYELVFAYPDGDTSRPGNLEAGSQVRLMLQGLGYRGYAVYEMQAGMGDVVIAPLYLVLKKRGVKFEFFQRVTDVSPAPAKAGAKPQIGTVTISQQVTFDPKKPPYDPLFDVGGLPCWPIEPFYEQIVEGPQLEREEINLESHWTKWKDTGPTTVLEYGKDFEHVVYAIGMGAVPIICGGLVEASSEWQAMVAAVPTVATQWVGLHLKPDLACLGWKGEKPILGTYTASPLSNWADASQTIAAEVWPPDTVGNIAYLCGMLQSPEMLPPGGDHDYPKQKLDQAIEITETFLDDNAGVLWPDAVDANGVFDRKLLVSANLHRTNIDPSERYAQSPTNSTIHKLAPNASGFEGLYVAGEWTKNGTNIGNVEGTISSGMQCATAIAEVRSEPSQGPHYVEHGGMMSFPAPVALQNATMHGFILNGDKERIQALLDHMFLEPTGGELRFVPLTNKVLLAFADLPKASFPSMPEWGWGKEHDVAFWIPVAGLKRASDGGWKLDQVAWFLPYLWVDQPTGLVSGREVFGFQKEFGTSCIPDQPLGGKFTLDTWVLDKFSPETEGKICRAMTLTPRFGSVPEDAIQGEYKDFKGIYRHLVRTLVPKQGIQLEDGTSIDAAALIAQLEQLLLDHQMPMVFLKQFRGIEGGDSCCYQAVTQANVKVGRIQGVNISPLYEFKLESFANLPITEELGIASQNVLMQIAVTLDLEMLPGEEIWNAHS